MSRSAAVCAAILFALIGYTAPASYAASAESALDGRAWELVSPVEKNGGDVQVPSAAGAGVLQAAAGSGILAFGSATSFGDAEGAAPVSQYLSSRSGEGWGTANITPPQLSGTYGGGAYQLFSPDLSRALLSSGWRCRDGASECAAANPPLGSGAPAGYRNIYLRESGAYTPLITGADAAGFAPAEQFQLSLAGAAPDLRHVLIAAESDLYEWGEGTLEKVNTAPGAALAAPSGAISADGSRVYFTQGGDLYLREGGALAQVDEAEGGGGTFQAASADGTLAFFTREQTGSGRHLYRYDALTKETTDLTPSGEVEGVLGASADGSYLYFSAASDLYLRHGGTTVLIAAPPFADPAPVVDAGDYPPATGTARVTPDGTRLVFVSKARLTGYANVGKAEIFLYEAAAGRLLCASCNPRESTPAGPASIPGALAAGEGGPAAYKPRVLSDDGSHVFFTSADALLFSDTDGHPDAYEWEAPGAGGCAKKGGCIGLLSSGRSGEASFLDASADGADAYFLTDASLLPADTSSVDVYDARAGGGFVEPPAPIPCNGDDCQGPPPGPEDPTPGTATLIGPENPPVHFPKARKKKRHRKRHHHRKHHRAHRNGRR